MTGLLRSQLLRLTVICRGEMQQWFEELNPTWTIAEIGELRPDGDVDIPERALETFRVPACPKCGPGSILKTDVIFFGDNVPRKVVDHCYQMVSSLNLIM